MCLAVCTEDGKVATDCEIDFSHCLQDAIGGDCAFAYARDDLAYHVKTLCASPDASTQYEWKGNTVLLHVLCTFLDL